MARQEPRGGGVRASNKQAAGVGGMGRHDDGVAGVEMGGGGRSTTEEEEEEKQAGPTWVCWAVVAGVAALGLAGGGVLVWWAVAFHPAHQQLWMVPVGLVLLGTPLVAWLSLFASGACRRLGHLRVGAGADQPPLAMAGR